MKLVQQHAVVQPSGKKLRVTGNYTGVDSSDYDFQVNYAEMFVFSVNTYDSFHLEKPKPATANLSTTRLLICLCWQR